MNALTTRTRIAHWYWLLPLLLLGFVQKNAAQCPTAPLTLSTQAQIDAFPTTYPGCTVMPFTLFIQGNDIANLNGLSQLTGINGVLQISNCPSLPNLTGLNNLQFIAGGMGLLNNGVTSLNGLNSLNNALVMSIVNNDQLTDLSALVQLTTVGNLQFQGNDALTNLNGLQNLTATGGMLFIDNNDALTDLSALSNLASIGGDLTITNNNLLPNLNGLNAVTAVGGSLQIKSNNVLSTVTQLLQLGSINGSLTVTGNPLLPTLSGLDNIDYTTITNLQLQGTNLAICHVQSVCNYLLLTNNPASASGVATCANVPAIEAACLAPELDITEVQLECVGGGYQLSLLFSNVSANPIQSLNLSGTGLGLPAGGVVQFNPPVQAGQSEQVTLPVLSGLSVGQQICQFNATATAQGGNTYAFVVETGMPCATAPACDPCNTITFLSQPEINPNGQLCCYNVSLTNELASGGFNGFLIKSQDNLPFELQINAPYTPNEWFTPNSSPAAAYSLTHLPVGNVPVGTLSNLFKVCRSNVSGPQVFEIQVPVNSPQNPALTCPKDLTLEFDCNIPTCPTCPTVCSPTCSVNPTVGLDLSTGANGGAAMSPGTYDTDWVLTAAPTTGLTLPRPASVIGNYPSWATLPNTAWISAYPTPNFNQANLPPAVPYRFENCFSVCQPTVLDITANVHVDNQVRLYLRNQCDSTELGTVLSINTYSTSTFTNPPETGTLSVPVAAGGYCLVADLVNNDGPMGLDMEVQVRGEHLVNPACCANYNAVLGHKYRDNNCNGLQEAHLGEVGLAGWTFQLVHPVTNAVAYTTVSDASGFFKFEQITPGTYFLREVNQSGWTQTQPGGTNGGYPVTIGADQVLGNFQFGNCQPPACTPVAIGFQPIAGSCCAQLSIGQPAADIQSVELVATVGTTLSVGNVLANWAVQTLAPHHIRLLNNGAVTAVNLAQVCTNAGALVQVNVQGAIGTPAFCAVVRELNCTVAPASCDSVSVILESLHQPLGTTPCMFRLHLQNNAPAGAFDQIRLTNAQTGAPITANITAGVQWTLTTAFGQAVLSPVSGPVPNGFTQSIAYFEVPGGIQEDIVVAWMQDSAVICTDTLHLDCPKPPCPQLELAFTVPTVENNCDLGVEIVTNGGGVDQLVFLLPTPEPAYSFANPPFFVSAQPGAVLVTVAGNPGAPFPVGSSFGFTAVPLPNGPQVVPYFYSANGWACADTLILPNCQPDTVDCTQIDLSATLQTQGDSCCYQIDLTNNLPAGTLGQSFILTSPTPIAVTSLHPDWAAYPWGFIPDGTVIQVEYTGGGPIPAGTATNFLSICVDNGQSQTITVNWGADIPCPDSLVLGCTVDTCALQVQALPITPACGDSVCCFHIDINNVQNSAASLRFYSSDGSFIQFGNGATGWTLTTNPNAPSWIDAVPSNGGPVPSGNLGQLMDICLPYGSTQTIYVDLVDAFGNGLCGDTLDLSCASPCTAVDLNQGWAISSDNTGQVALQNNQIQFNQTPNNFSDIRVYRPLTAPLGDTWDARFRLNVANNAADGGLFVPFMATAGTQGIGGFSSGVQQAAIGVWAETNAALWSGKARLSAFFKPDNNSNPYNTELVINCPIFIDLGTEYEVVLRRTGATEGKIEILANGLTLGECCFDIFLPVTGLTHIQASNLPLGLPNFTSDATVHDLSICNPGTACECNTAPNNWCSAIGQPEIRCENGRLQYCFTVTNAGNTPLNGPVFVTSNTPGVVLFPNPVQVSLAPGQAQEYCTEVQGSVPPAAGTVLCAAIGPDTLLPCLTTCLEVPMGCDTLPICMEWADAATCVGGTAQLTIQFVHHFDNLQGVELMPPPGVIFEPTSFQGPFVAGQTYTFTVTVTGPTAGTNVCYEWFPLVLTNPVDPPLPAVCTPNGSNTACFVMPDCAIPCTPAQLTAQPTPDTTDCCSLLSLGAGIGAVQQFTLSAPAGIGLSATVTAGSGWSVTGSGTSVLVFSGTASASVSGFATVCATGDASVVVTFGNGNFCADTLVLDCPDDCASCGDDDCFSIVGDAFECVNGQPQYRFWLKNKTEHAIRSIVLIPSNTNIEVNPDEVVLPQPGLLPGQTGGPYTLDLVGTWVPGSSFCYVLEINDLPLQDNPTFTQRDTVDTGCREIPVCPQSACLAPENNRLRCEETGRLLYSFTLTNTSAIPLQSLQPFVANNSDSSKLIVAPIALVPALLPGQSRTFEVEVYKWGHFNAGDPVCLRLVGWNTETPMPMSDVQLACDTLCLALPACACNDTACYTCCTAADLLLPTGISPNNDQINDLYQIGSGDKVCPLTLAVYNRWGNLVWKQEETYENDWDGTNQDGVPLPEGTYYVLVRLKATGQVVTQFVDIKK